MMESETLAFARLKEVVAECGYCGLCGMQGRTITLDMGGATFDQMRQLHDALRQMLAAIAESAPETQSTTA